MDTTLRTANQPPPLVGYDLFSENRPLVEALEREGGAHAVELCADFGRLCGGEPLELGRLANEHPPLLRTHDRFGERIDDVEFHPAWHALLRLGVEHGLHTTAAGHVTRAALFMVTGAALVGTLLLARWIVTSKLGRVLTAIRDAETRAAFCGYNTVHYKVAVFTLSAVLCGIAGALYVPQVGIINPGEMSPANSIEIAIWVALGGRGTLVGPILGAGVVNGAKSFFTQAFPEYWLYFLGAIFILATLFLPQGIAGLAQKLRSART